MSKLNMVTVVGARPQFIKAAVISRLIESREYRDRISEYMIHTGQHYDENMSGVFFSEMGIRAPDLNLSVGSKSHGAMTGEMLVKIEKVLMERSPDLIILYGDTNSTLAGALAASKLGLPIAHIEAGLRNFSKNMPEEQNRIITDHLSTWLFSPTEEGVKNLMNEGLSPAGSEDKASNNRPFIGNVGDVMYDASLHFRKLVEKRNASESILSRIGLKGNYRLVTIHRPENTDCPEKLRNIMKALNECSNLEMVFPMHPRAKKAFEANGIRLATHIHVIDPVGYLDMLELETNCVEIVTDSGGVQKEAYFFKKPCITLYETTGWVELIECGWMRLVGADYNKIVEALSSVSQKRDWVPFYGDGNAGEKILVQIERSLAN